MDRSLLNGGNDGVPVSPLRQKVGVGLIVSVVCIGVGCIYTATNPEIIVLDAANGDVTWTNTTCEVLAVGMDYVGSCDAGSRDNVNDGNYSRCSPYLFCAEEGANETCECTGTAQFGTRGLDQLETRAVESEVSGSIGCNAAGFGHADPAPFFSKQCWCRPERLAAIDPQRVTPHACAEASSLSGWVEQNNGSACVDAYLSWALVTVVGDGSEPSVTRCAYEYGSPPMSWTHDGQQAKRYLDDTLRVNIGQTTDCHVLNNPPGGVELGALEDCVVGFSVNTTKLVAWATQWGAQASFRYQVCWTALGIGFFIVAPLLAYRFKLVGED